MLQQFFELSIQQQASLVCLFMFFAVGIVDGLYFHLYKYQLHAHKESQFEHLIHTFRSFVFCPIAILFYVYDSSGKLFWLGLGLLAFDLILETIDVLVEKNARQNLGGISSVEAAVHVIATGFRTASLAFIISTKPLTEWSWSAEKSLTLQPQALAAVGALFAFVSFLGGISHLYLYFREQCKKECSLEKKQNVNTQLQKKIKADFCPRQV